MPDIVVDWRWDPDWLQGHAFVPGAPMSVCEHEYLADCYDYFESEHVWQCRLCRSALRRLAKAYSKMCENHRDPSSVSGVR